MTHVEQKLAERGLVLPAEVVPPPGATVAFQWVRVSGRRAFLSGHAALSPEGTLLGPFGSVPSRVSIAQAQTSASGALLAMLASIKRAVGDLDQVAAWMTITGFVNADPGFPDATQVMNPMSELLVGIYGPDVGSHARVAPGVAALPFDVPVILSAEIELHD